MTHVVFTVQSVSLNPLGTRAGKLWQLVPPPGGALPHPSGLSTQVAGGSVGPGVGIDVGPVDGMGVVGPSVGPGVGIGVVGAGVGAAEGSGVVGAGVGPGDGMGVVGAGVGAVEGSGVVGAGVGPVDGMGDGSDVTGDGVDGVGSAVGSAVSPTGAAVGNSEGTAVGPSASPTCATEQSPPVHSGGVARRRRGSSPVFLNCRWAQPWKALVTGP